MKKKYTYGYEPWIKRISKQEMPALASTVKALENIARDDTASLTKLGQTVLHDHALTSAILKVANSSLYINRVPVTTVSRATVKLGLTTIKNICITAKVLNSLLKNKNLCPAVYERLLKLMAQSFHSAMLAKMMVKEYDHDVQEETFIAALLYRLGESAFWSIGGEITEDLDKQLIGSIDKPQSVVKNFLGVNFEELSLGLAKNWQLGEILIHALEDPQLRTPEIQSIELSVNLSEALSSEYKQPVTHIYEKMAQLMKIDSKLMHQNVEICTKQTIKLLRYYGASILIKYIKQTHQTDSFIEKVEPELSNHALQLKILRELTCLPTENGDINMILQTALEGIFRGIKMDKAIILLKSQNHKSLEPRLISSKYASKVKQDFLINIAKTDHIFNYVLNNQEAVWVTSLNDSHWINYLNNTIRNIVSYNGFFIAPIILEHVCIGVFYADRDPVNIDKGFSKVLNHDDFLSFTHFSQQTNLCLNMIQS